MATIQLTEPAEVLIKSVCKRFRNDAHELINVLHELQHELGYLPPEVQSAVAKELQITVAVLVEAVNLIIMAIRKYCFNVNKRCIVRTN